MEERQRRLLRLSDGHKEALDGRVLEAVELVGGLDDVLEERGGGLEHLDQVERGGSEMESQKSRLK